MIRFSVIGGQVLSVRIVDEKPRSQCPRHQICMLALPAKARPMGQRLFHQRRRIHKNFHVRLRYTRKPRRNFLELALHHIMVIPVQRIA